MNEYKQWEKDQIEKEKRIVAKYPFLRMRADCNCSYKDTKWPMMALEIPDGWLKLFFQMCDDIKPLAPDDFYFLQVKEKFNQLVCYCSTSVKEIEDILNKYKMMAYYICTKCGKPAAYETQGYFASYCEDCWKGFTRHERVERIEFSPEFVVKTWTKEGTYEKTMSFEDEWNRYVRENGYNKT